MVHKENNKILIHACCGICSGYPIGLLKEMGYMPVVYFCNPNLDTKEEFEKRLEAQQTICAHHNVKLIIEEYNHNSFLSYIKGLENEPERGARCDKCIKLRLTMTANKAIELGIDKFTTSLVISPHKNFEKISDGWYLLPDDSEIEVCALPDFEADDDTPQASYEKTAGATPSSPEEVEFDYSPEEIPTNICITFRAKI